LIWQFISFINITVMCPSHSSSFYSLPVQNECKFDRGMTFEKFTFKFELNHEIYKLCLGLPVLCSVPQSTVCM
jgi:hypothetical protein